METFTELKDFVDNPRYHEQRQRMVQDLDIDLIDAPIVDIVNGFTKLPYCFTLQSCYGHFLYNGQTNPQNVEPLPASGNITSVEYRIAYVALCIEDSKPGRRLFDDLREVPAIDPDHIQFGCAEWFWKRQVNSYALQVEPERHMTQDTAQVGYQEALHIEKVRNRFFARLGELLQGRFK